MIDATKALDPEWKVQERPPLMTRRYEFGSYAETRTFLDLLADASERRGYYPDLNFGRTHVVVSVAPLEGKTLSGTEYDFAAESDTLATQARS